MSVDEFGHNMGQLVNGWTHGSFYNSTLLMTGAAFPDFYQTTADRNAASLVFPLETDLRPPPLPTPHPIPHHATYSMFCSTILGVAFRKLTVVPGYLGYLGYVSSLAKESLYVRIKDGGAKLDGIGGVRGIKNLRVRLGNGGEGAGEMGRWLWKSRGYETYSEK